MKKWHLEKNAPEPGTLLCNVSDVETNGILEFRFGENKKTMFRMFIHNDEGTLRAYMNVCPHFNVPLNVRPGELFTADGGQFQCSIHYAKFNLDDGHCTDGPCEGLGLESIPLVIKSDAIYVGEHLS